ncbi:MAG TPA: phosphatase PAP2 family protein [Tepidisphaeraceae bacterium]|nr:phosphatase PAP2 family protein [Tepidisphaeraceae bacterium]
MTVNWFLTAALVVACVALMLIERRTGTRLVLTLRVKSDIKRETRFLAQYGQFACTAVAVLIVWSLGGSRWRNADAGVAVPLAAAPLAAGVLGALVKRLLGRVRPGHENAGRFMGVDLAHANYRESFPSNHTACAVALTVGLAYLYPPAAWVFWLLAAACGLLRYLQDAHWPSDVAGGAAFGYLIAVGVWRGIYALGGHAM